MKYTLYLLPWDGSKCAAQQLSLNAPLFFTHLILLFVCPSIPFFVCNISFVWSRLVRWCVQALNILGVPQCSASFSVCVCMCPRPEVSLDGLSRYSINMFPLIRSAVFSCAAQKQAPSSYTGNSRIHFHCTIWICCCLFPHLGSH